MALEFQTPMTGKKMAMMRFRRSVFCFFVCFFQPRARFCFLDVDFVRTFSLGWKVSWLNWRKKKHDRTKPQEQLFWGKEASSVESFYYDLTGLDRWNHMI